jgi:hypothetical protein
MMRTPAGKECPEYYEDFHRRRNIQECRLAKRNPDSARWQPGDCKRCNVPDILRANASPHLRLKLTIRSGILGLGRSVLVEATCEKHRQAIADPYVGCERCNSERPSISAFIDALEGHDQD